MHYDLIVCGAGPAGSIAACTAARAGLKVALIEKYPLPRHKTCGGGVPMSMNQFLYDLSPDAFVEANVRRIRHTWNFEDEFFNEINLNSARNSSALWMLQRSVFDNALSQQAVRAGVDLQDNLTVTSVELERNCVRVHLRAFSSILNNQEKMPFSVTADWVIGADGANGETVKATKLRKNAKMAIAIEAEIPYSWKLNQQKVTSDLVHLEYGAIKNGYAWIFPKEEHLNVGAGLFHDADYKNVNMKSTTQSFKKVIVEYLRSLEIPYNAKYLKFKAHPLPYWSRQENLHHDDGRILLVGDAAGLVNPLFFDGILHAVKSGYIAANCIVHNQALQYTKQVCEEITRDFKTAHQISYIFYKYPEFFYKNIVKRNSSANIAVRLISGDMKYREVPSNFFKHVVRYLTKS
jgi:geranylgeranyl reductase family protein